MEMASDQKMEFPCWKWPLLLLMLLLFKEKNIGMASASDASTPCWARSKAESSTAPWRHLSFERFRVSAFRNSKLETYFSLKIYFSKRLLKLTQFFIFLKNYCLNFIL